MAGILDDPFPARHWIYLDRDSTHEVHAEVEPVDRAARFVVTEFPRGCRDAAEVVRLETPVDSPWEVDYERGELEARLSVLGAYARRELRETAWAALPVRRPDALRLDGHAFPIPGAEGARLEIHHFHDGRAGLDRVLVALPRVDLHVRRHALADLTFRFPDVEAGALALRHTRLTDATLRSLLARDHLELPRRGYAKLVTPGEYAAAYGGDWRQEVRRGFAAVARRVLEGHLEPPPEERSSSIPRVDLDTLRDALAAPTVARVRARYLTPQREAELLAQGELPIRRWVAGRRREAAHGEQHLLTLLEGYLLSTYGLRSGNAPLCQREGLKLLRAVGALA